MTEKDYSMLVLWSEDDEAFLARVLELPGCIAHGETRTEAVENAQIAIENWVETARELGRPVPKPMGVEEFTAQAAAQTEELHERFEKAVKKAVEEALHAIIPSLVSNMEDFLQRDPTTRIDLYRGQSWVGTSHQRVFMLSPEHKKR